jgi:hypothetical protein
MILPYTKRLPTGCQASNLLLSICLAILIFSNGLRLLEQTSNTEQNTWRMKGSSKERRVQVMLFGANHQRLNAKWKSTRMTRPMQSKPET